MEIWDPVAFKALLRTTSQRLGQLQERKDSQGQLTRRDIATYLSQGQLAAARAKAAALIQEDVMSDLLEELEMFVGVVRSHVGELEVGPRIGLGLGEEVNGQGESETLKGSGRMGTPSRFSPILIEAAASIIHAAPGIGESKDLNAVREVLIQRLGPAFAQTASASRNNHVSPRVMQILSSPPSTASKMDAYLVDIAQTYGVKWVPEPRREDLLNVISGILDTDAGLSPIVDLPRLRAICARGLPDDPPWVRPRIWKLLFGTLPILKTTWAKESQKQRDSYYDLVRRLLTPLASLPAPIDPLSPTDVLLLRISESLFRVSPDLFSLLGNEPKSTPTAPDNIHISSASNLDKRLSLLKGDGDAGETPEIRLESDLNCPEPASPPPPPSVTSLASRRQRQTTLLPSRAYNAPPAHRGHISALLRLLYIHSTLNPAVQSPHVPWLLIPIYSALVGETDEDVAAHAEADTFWIFEALVGEIVEMEEEGGKNWMRKLSERLRWADGDLATSLHATGLDPVLPHYSYRWLAPLLAQTLPLSAVFPVWDVLFACPMRTRDVNSKLEYLVDICTALLVRARTPLFRLGKPGRNTAGLWTQEHTALPPPSPLRPWELSDAFTEGNALLTSYPIDAAGGIDRILQTASDLARKRIQEGEREKEKERQNVGFGARIKRQMWKGFTNQVADESPEEDEDEEDEEEEEEENGNDEKGEYDDGNETETPAAPTLTSRLANTVWRGITNQSSMDDEVPSPPSPMSARHSPTPPEEPSVESIPSSQASLWNYAGKLKDSDTVAAFSKVSTNWHAKALDAWRVRKGSNVSASSRPVTPAQPMVANAASEISPRQSPWLGLSGAGAPGQRRGSLPGTQLESEHANLDPPRPAFFRSPRESFLPQPRRQHSTAPSSPNIKPTSLPLRDSDTESNASSLLHRAGTSLTSLATFQLSQSMPKSVPRPLMLNSRDLITTKSSQPPSARSEGAPPEYRGGPGQWSDVLLAAKNRHSLRQASLSSTSSLSLPEAMNRSPHATSGAFARSGSTNPRSDYESDGSAAASRRVPLNRKSVSPMALASRSPHMTWNAPSPGVGYSPGHPLSNGSVTAEDIQTLSESGWRQFEDKNHSSAPSMPSMMTRTTTGFDSPTTIASPPIPRTPLMPAVPGPGVVRIVNGGTAGEGGHIATSSISTLSEASEIIAAPLEPPTQSRIVQRKKTPPLPLDSHGDTLPSTDTGSGSELDLERTPSGKAPVKLRSKRYVQRPGHLHLRPAPAGTTGHAQGTSDQRTPSPGRRSLVAEWPGEYDLAATPRVESYSVGIKEEGEREEGVCAVASRPQCVRKLSKEARLRKVPSAGIRDAKRTRESGAEEGDDEGYDDLLSAYESGEGSRE
ncbi:regulator of Vps4 activity in the MVB pathway-domain-containing protein [Boletus edulis]|nr:regulator of Vps4 activity in the MVB pathway-domain-containing protein [Boletus edulis]